MEGPEITFAEAVIDNGSFGTRTVRFETGRLAKQAGGAVAAYLDEDTMLLSTTTAGKSPREGFDFFPLTVDVEERMYAAGKIPGSFFRREGRPSTDAILTCRLIDRPLRPTFRKGLRNEVQVVITVLSLNPDHQYDVLAINHNVGIRRGWFGDYLFDTPEQSCLALRSSDGAALASEAVAAYQTEGHYDGRRLDAVPEHVLQIVAQRRPQPPLLDQQDRRRGHHLVVVVNELRQRILDIARPRLVDDVAAPDPFLGRHVLDQQHHPATQITGEHVVEQLGGARSLPRVRRAQRTADR